MRQVNLLRSPNSQVKYKNFALTKLRNFLSDQEFLKKTTRRMKMKKLAKLTMALFVISSAAACNTLSGVGQDLESAGEAIERTAETNS